MNEHETDLIREYVHIQYLIKEIIAELDRLPNRRISLIAILIKYTKNLGQRLRSRHNEVRRELSKMRIQVWVEDDGGEVIFVCTSKNMVKGRHGVKRRILYEDMEHTLAQISAAIVAEAVDTPYKAEVYDRDPYA